MRRILFGFIIFMFFISNIKADEVCGDDVDPTGVSYVVERNDYGYQIIFTGLDNLFPGQTISSIRGIIDGSIFTCNGLYFHAIDGTFHYNEPHNLTKNSDGKWVFSVPNDWVLRNGNDKISLNLLVNNVYYNLSELINITKPNIELPSLNERYSFKDTSLTGPIHHSDDGDTIEHRTYYIAGNFPYSTASLNYKVGIIKDMFLLESLENNSPDALSNLLQYAKNDDSVEPQIYADPFGISTAISYDDWDIKENVIYYFYVDYKFSGYSNTEGVSVLQGVSEFGNILLSDEVDFSKMSNALYAVDPNTNPDGNQDTNVDDNNDNNNNDSNVEEVKNDNKPVDTSTVDNPSTGLSIGIITICVLLIIGILIFKYNRRKMFKI
ncbi:MAG: hypothetical protein IKQ29_00860 [Bacilli bacterium]|nr:hypothetical protein [Bacilli bacterium]